MSLKKKVLFNTGAQFVNRLAISGSAFLVSLLIARYFGVRGFGEYSKATTFIAIFYLFADFGINAVVLKEINDKPREEKKIIGNLFGLRMLLGIFLTIIAVLITFFLPYDSSRNEGFTPLSKMAIFALCPLILYQAYVNTVSAIFQKNLKYERMAIAGFLGSVATLIAVFILLLFKNSLPVVMLGYLFGAVIGVLFYQLLVKKVFADFSLFFSVEKMKKIIIASIPLGLTLIFNLVYFRADIFILTYYRTTSEVGVYGLAYKFFEFALTIPALFANSLYPILLNRSKDKQVFKQTTFKAGGFLLLMSFFVMVFFYVSSPLLVLIRDDFYPSISILRTLSFSMPFFFLSSLFMWILITYGKNKQLLYIYFLGMIVNLLLNFLFIPLYGINAAVVITILSEFLIMILSGLVSYRLVMLR